MIGPISGADRMHELHKLTAFSDDPLGGNPAGVWIGDDLPSNTSMQQIAADVGYSETAFLAPRHGFHRSIRYYSPLAEVDFCGHATIASGVALGMLDGIGEYHFASKVGDIVVRVEQQRGLYQSTLTSVDTRYKFADADLLSSILKTLGWSHQEIDTSIPPALAFAGASHFVLAAKSLKRLNSLEYDFDLLQALMHQHQLTTIQLLYRESDHLYHSRNPFPVGGVVEDPATGAAAAAFGGYLRDSGMLQAPFEFQIRQGEAMGRPSLLGVSVPTLGGVSVSGTAVTIP